MVGAVVPNSSSSMVVACFLFGASVTTLLCRSSLQGADDVKNIRRFPWDGSSQERNEPDVIIAKDATSRRKEEENNSTEQLEFLASMTFSNGGLRAPSCLCCQ
jgi:hypothetical protein